MGEKVSARPPAQRVVECELLIVGGGLGGSAAAYEALLAGKTVCLTEMTDWVGGQLSSQGTAALDEANKQRAWQFFPRGYNLFRQGIEAKYGTLNPGDCWVSVSCFLPKDGHAILWQMLQEAEQTGKGKLYFFPNTVIKELDFSADNKQIIRAIAIQHQPQSNTPPLNTDLLSQIYADIYSYEHSPRLRKQIIQFQPLMGRKRQTAPWYVIEATDTGEIIALADVPYRLGLDRRTHLDPSAPTVEDDNYCTQGFTFTFAMEHTATPQPQVKPEFYERYLNNYSFDTNPRIADFNNVFTYRRIWRNPNQPRIPFPPFRVGLPQPGDISMQNWTWGNDYRPGTDRDNLIYSRRQLLELGQLQRGQWRGGLRVEALRKAEETALGFYYWLVAGTTDSQVPDRIIMPNPNNRLLTGLDAPMGTAHGLSKFPYIRESRRIIGRPSYGYPDGFMVNEIDISRQNFRSEFYRQNLSPEMYRNLWVRLAGLDKIRVIRGELSVDEVNPRTRSSIYPDSVGISQYAIDFHPCLAGYPAEKMGNIERPNVRQAQGPAYPAQIPLRALIPQKVDNLLVTGKSIANSTIAAAAYRVHPFEWSAGAAAGTTAVFALERDIFPYQLTEHLPRFNPLLHELQKRLTANGNPIAFPNTSIFNLDWSAWRVW
ncbi:MAG: FAD-dependent oxidoreductase [Pseudanabaenaceae cyanobacterium]